MTREYRRAHAKSYRQPPDSTDVPRRTHGYLLVGDKQLAAVLTAGPRSSAKSLSLRQNGKQLYAPHEGAVCWDS